MGVLHRSTFRLCVSLLASFQLAMSVAVPIADAALESANVALPTHIEAATDAGCVAAHDHSFCQLCRTINLAGIPHEGVALHHGPAPVGNRCSIPERSPLGAKTYPAGPNGPRAPPLA